jgi:tetratricopeptide (TPR) repeat protein
MHHAGLRSAAGSMISHCDLARIGFIVAACLGVGGFASAQGAHSLACSGPPSLEAQLRAHPDADAYIALGVWFDRHQQWECADRTIRSGLKIAPDSARLNYLLGFGLYSTGQAQEAIAPLRQAVHIDPDVLQPHLLLVPRWPAWAIIGRLLENGRRRSKSILPQRRRWMDWCGA